MSEHPEPAAPMLAFRDVSFGFGERLVLNRFSWTLAPGACCALIGPNGAGKTTLLRLASGVLGAQGGEVLLAGEPVRRMSAKERARSIALVPQTLEIPFDFTVQQIVEQGRTPHLARLRGLARTDHEAVERALALTHADMLRDRIFNELSGGERQRVKIALGLAQEPRLLLLDEPAQNLDVGRQVELLDLLASLRDEGYTILASIHDLHLIEGNFDPVLLLREDGPPVAGTAREVLEPERLAEVFRCERGRHPLLR